MSQMYPGPEDPDLGVFVAQVERALAARDAPHLLERRRGRRSVPLRPHPRRALELAALRLRVDALELDRIRLRLGEAVHADDYTPPLLDLRVVPVRGFLDLALDESLLHGLHGSAQLVHPLDQLPRLLLELPRQGLDEIGAS